MNNYQQKIVQYVNGCYRYHDAKDKEQEMEEVLNNLLDRYQDNIDNKNMTDVESYNDCIKHAQGLGKETIYSKEKLPIENILLNSSLILCISGLIMSFLHWLVAFFLLMTSIILYSTACSLLNSKARKSEEEGLPLQIRNEYYYRKFKYLKLCFVMWCIQIIPLLTDVTSKLIPLIILFFNKKALQIILVFFIVSADITIFVLSIIYSIKIYKRIKNTFEYETGLSFDEISAHEKNERHYRIRQQALKNQEKLIEKSLDKPQLKNKKKEERQLIKKTKFFKFTSIATNIFIVLPILVFSSLSLDSLEIYCKNPGNFESAIFLAAPLEISILFAIFSVASLIFYFISKYKWKFGFVSPIMFFGMMIPLLCKFYFKSTNEYEIVMLSSANNVAFIITNFILLFYIVTDAFTIANILDRKKQYELR